MLTVAIPKRNKLQNIIVLTPKDGTFCRNAGCAEACRSLQYDGRRRTYKLRGRIKAGMGWPGTGSFPNKRILRNNLCLPACKLLYLDKREKNFLLTDIIPVFRS